MQSDIFIQYKEYTFEESMHILARAIASIVDENEEIVFSSSDLSCLLRSVNECLPGEFAMRQTRSEHYQVVYKSEDEVVESFKERWKGFIE